MKHEGFTFGHEQHCTLGIPSIVNGFRSGEKQMFVDTDDGESASRPLEAWPPCPVARKKHQVQQLLPREGLLESELL